MSAVSVLFPKLFCYGARMVVRLLLLKFSMVKRVDHAALKLKGFIYNHPIQRKVVLYKNYFLFNLAFVAWESYLALK